MGKGFITVNDGGKGMASLSLSVATELDVSSVHGLLVDWEEEGITIGQVAPRQDYVRSFLSECFLVARLLDTIVGFVCARIVDNPGYVVTSSAPRVLQIEELFVQRNLRRQGIGMALVHEVLQIARRQGVSAFHVFSANQDIEGVTRFYRRQGFVPWGVQLYRSES